MGILGNMTRHISCKKVQCLNTSLDVPYCGRQSHEWLHPAVTTTLVSVATFFEGLLLTERLAFSAHIRQSSMVIFSPTCCIRRRFLFVLDFCLKLAPLSFLRLCCRLHGRAESIKQGGLIEFDYTWYMVVLLLWRDQQGEAVLVERYDILCEDGVAHLVWRFYEHTLVCSVFPFPWVLSRVYFRRAINYFMFGCDLVGTL